MSKTPRGDIYSLSKQFRKEVMRGESKSVNSLLSAWRIAERRILRRLKYLLREIESAQFAGVEISLAWLYKQERFEQLLSSIQHESLELADRARTITSKRQDALVKKAISDADVLLQSTGVHGNFLSIDAEAFRHSVSYLADGTPLASIFQKIAPEALESARRVFAEGMADGANPRKIAENLMRKLDVPERRAVLIARTESLRAYRTAHQAVFEANSDVVSGVRVSSSRDGRTCVLCLAQDGKVLQHREQFATHPGCRCALLPVVIGVTPDRGTGDEWLRKQSKKRQLEALGPTRHELWKSGMATLPELIEYDRDPQWGKGVKLRRLDSLRV